MTNADARRALIELIKRLQADDSIRVDLSDLCQDPCERCGGNGIDLKCSSGRCQDCEKSEACGYHWKHSGRCWTPSVLTDDPPPQVEEIATMFASLIKRAEELEVKITMQSILGHTSLSLDGCHFWFGSQESTD